MKVTVLLFANIRESLQTPRLELDLPPNSKAADALAELTRRHPAVQKSLTACSIALDQQIADANAALHENCELAILPPVSGG